jgi:hypothetical protein
MKNWIVVIAVFPLVLVILCHCDSSSSKLADEWCSVKLDSLQHGVIVLENSQLLIRYKRHSTDFECNFIKDFIIKEVDEDQAGESYGLDEIYYGHAGSEKLTHAEVVHQDADSLMVYLQWSNGPTKQRVTMYRDSRIVKLEYLSYGTGICDIGAPGENDTETDKNKYVFHGGDKWPKGYLRYPLGFYYREPPHDFGMVGWKGNGPGDKGPGSLDYKGYFIMGVYHAEKGSGFGRVMPTDVLDCVNLLDGKGFEHVPYYKREHRPYTGFLFGVTGGAEEILNVGKKIVDSIP